MITPIGSATSNSLGDPSGRRGPDRTSEFEQALLDLALQVGENDAAVRRDALTGLASLGIELDEHLHASPVRGARVISAQKSPTTVLVIWRLLAVLLGLPGVLRRTHSG